MIIHRGIGFVNVFAVYFFIFYKIFKRFLFPFEDRLQTLDFVQDKPKA